MTISLNKQVLALTTLNLLAVTSAQAAFFEDSKTSVDSRTYYLQNDFREGSGQSRNEETAQGFTFRFQSGFTEGAFGFGLDAALMTGFKLDSSPERSGTGLLPVSGESRPGRPAYAREAADEYSKLALTAKMRLFQDSEVQLGTIAPELPLLIPSATRLFRQDFNGAQVINTSIDGLTLKAGRLEQNRERNSTHYEGIGIASAGGRYPQADGGNFNYLSADYALSKDNIVSYAAGELEDVYRQQYLGLRSKVDAGPGRVVSEVRLFSSRDSGAANAGSLDNQVYSGLFGYEWQGHTLLGGYQKVDGEGAYPYVDGTVTYLLTQMMVTNFGRENQRSWIGRYIYDFSKLGVNGLTLTLRYVKSDDAQIRGFVGEGREHEFNTDLNYVVQSGSLKGLGLRWQHGVMRSNYQRDTDQDRVILDYSFKL